MWEVRASGASDNSGGGFVAGAAGTDRSQQNAAQVAINNATITTSITTNVITFTLGYTPTSADVGNIVQMLTGTNVTAGFYQITAQTGTTWTVDRNVVTSGTTTNATGNMGGALATLAKLAGILTISQKAFVTGAFTSNATTTFAPGNVNPSGAIPPTRLVGYGSVRGDTGHATLTLNTNTGLTGITCGNNGFIMEQVDIDCASLGTSTAISNTGTSCGIRNCKVSNFTTRGIFVSSNAGHHIVDCEATGGGSAATAAIQVSNAGESVERCFVHDNQCHGIVGGFGAVIRFNLVVNNSGTSDGIQVNANSMVLNNTVHNNGRDGIRHIGSITANMQQWKNNLLTNNGGFGATFTTGTAVPASPDNDGNGYFNNSGGAKSGYDSTAGIFGVVPYTNVRDVTFTSSPYVGGTTGTTANFALNSTSGGGAAARGTGSPTSWLGNSGTTGAPDMGAVQHSDASGGGLKLVGRGGLAG